MQSYRKKLIVNFSHELTFLMPGLNLRLGYLIYQAAIKAGILLRPLGNTIYWLPPLNVTDEEIDELKNTTMKVLFEITF